MRGANMGGEDFSWYLQDIPGCYVRLGCRAPGTPTRPAHSSQFLVDEEVMAPGAMWLAEAARQAGRTLVTRVDDGALAGGAR